MTSLFFGVHEVRLFRPNGVAVGYFDNWDAALRAVENEPSYKAGYFTLNPLRLPEGIPINPQALTPSRNAAGNSDIARRTWLLVDLDPPRPAGVNSTDAEKQGAREQAESVREYLRGRGWPNPMLCDSGNGWHLLYRVDLPNDDSATELVRGILARLHQLCPMVDAGNHDAARLCKFYGSMARKGEHSEERPWRRSAIVEAGSGEIVTEAQLRDLAPIQDPTPQTATKATDEDLTRLLGFLDCYGVALRSEPREITGGWKIEVECPWEQEHSDKNRDDTVVCFIAGRGYGFNCKHSHCVNTRHWPEFRAELQRLHPDKKFSFVAESEPVGQVTLGSSQADSVRVAEKQPRPVFPDDAWAGTVFGEFAEIVCRGNFIRKRFASETFRAITGAIAGDQVTCGIAGVRLREFHSIIGNPQSGKSYGVDCAVTFYTAQSARCLFEPMLMLGGGSNSYRLTGIGAQRFLPGSSNSFVDELTRDDKKKHKKGEDVNVILGPLWKPTARLITIQGEAMALFSRLCSPDWTGQALSALVTDLYDSLDAEVAVTKDRGTPKIPGATAIQHVALHSTANLAQVHGRPHDGFRAVRSVLYRGQRVQA